jgi:pimeloyl-ACP methyl ester carboxylesterase
MIPTTLLTAWLTGLLGFGLLGGGAWLAHEWYRRAWVHDPDLGRHVFAPDPGLNSQTALLAAALALLVWAFAGALLVRLILRLAARGRPGPDIVPTHERTGTHQRIPRPDGSEIHVELHGADDGIPVVLVHGWGANGAEWNDLVARLGDRHRLIVWDLPGLGLSRAPENRDHSLEKYATDLDAVLDLAGGRPAVLVGHSIGGMILLTFARLYPESLGSRVAGLVLVHTTHTNPVRTTAKAPLHTALEGPVLVPLIHATIALSPVVRLMNAMSYLNGTAHLSSKRDGFAGTETPDRVEFVTRFVPQASPAVLARGMQAMRRYDATGVLPNVPVPTLVVAADRDPVCTPEASQRIASGIPGARLVTLAPAKHMGLLEHPARFAGLVADFAAACSAEATAPRRDGRG